MSLTAACHPTIEFQCKNGQCIHENRLCDGIMDCADETDEMDDICKYRRDSNAITLAPRL